MPTKRAKKPARRWQKVELAYLQRHAGDKTAEELATRFRTDVATIEAKLAELRPVAGGGSDEGLGRYQLGIEALYRQEWQTAEEHLAAAAAAADTPELAARARQFAASARAHQDEEAASADPYLLAVMAKNRGDHAAALALCTAGGRARKDGRFAYLAAAVCTLQEDVEAAAEHLGRAIQLDPRARIHALHDPDLAPLRSHPQHRGLFEA